MAASVMASAFAESPGNRRMIPSLYSCRKDSNSSVLILVIRRSVVICLFMLFIFIFLGARLTGPNSLCNQYTISVALRKKYFHLFSRSKTIDFIGSNRPAQQIVAANAGWRSHPSSGVTGPAWLDSAFNCDHIFVEF